MRIAAIFLFFLSSLAKAELLYDIDLTVARQGFDGKMCWVHARAGAIPPGTSSNSASSPLVVMTLQKLDVAGSDVYYALNEMRTSDLGTTWSAPVEHGSFARRPFRFRGKTDLEIMVCDFWPRWHSASGKLLGVGHTVVYEDNRGMLVRPRSTGYVRFMTRNRKPGHPGSR